MAGAGGTGPGRNTLKTFVAGGGTALVLVEAEQIVPVGRYQEVAVRKAAG